MSISNAIYFALLFDSTSKINISPGATAVVHPVNVVEYTNSADDSVGLALATIEFEFVGIAFVFQISSTVEVEASATILYPTIVPRYGIVFLPLAPVVIASVLETPNSKATVLTLSYKELPDMLVKATPSPTNEPVKNDAVMFVVTFNEFNSALLPEIITFFQFGTLYFYYGWLHRYGCDHFPIIVGPIICHKYYIYFLDTVLVGGVMGGSCAFWIELLTLFKSWVKKGASDP